MSLLNDEKIDYIRYNPNFITISDFRSCFSRATTKFYLIKSKNKKIFKKFLVFFIIFSILITPFIYIIPLIESTSSLSNTTTIISDNQNDYFGWNLSTAGDVNGDGFADIIIGAPHNDSNGVDSGAAYIFYGNSFFGRAINVSNANVTLKGTVANENFGWSMAGGGDIDSNGYDDIIVGAPGTSKAYIFLSWDDGSGIADGATPNITLTGNSTDKFGHSVALVSKFNKSTQGYDDVVVGAPYNDTWYNSTTVIQNTGAIYIFYGNGSMSNSITATEADIIYKGENSNNYYGFSVANAMDVNNDTYEDIIVGAPGFDCNRGRGYIYYGNQMFINEGFENYTGNEPTSPWTVYDNEINLIVDINTTVGHGLLGQCVELSDADNSDTVKLSNTVSISNHEYIIAEFSVKMEKNAGDNFYIRLCEGGTNGVRLSFGQTGNIRYYDSGPTNIMLYSANVWYNLKLIANTITDKFDLYIWDDSDVCPTTPNVNNGNFENTIDYFNSIIFGTYTNPDSIDKAWLDDVKIYNMSLLDNGNPGDNFSWSVSSAGDVDDDGYGDVIIGAPDFDSNPGIIDNNGRTYIYYGSDIKFWDTTILENVNLTGNKTNDRFGFSVSSAGDLDGSGIEDIIIGAPYHTNGTRTECGAAYVFLSNGSMATSLNASEADYINYGENAFDHFGIATASAKNFNDLATDEVIVSAPYYDVGLNNDVGKAYILSILPNPDYLEYLSGDNQEWFVGQDLPLSIRFKVLNETGEPVPGAKVNFTFISVPTGAIGYSLKESGTTFYQAMANNKGIVETLLHLGNKTGNYLINVSGDNFTGNSGPVFNQTINATAICGVLFNIELNPYYAYPSERKLTIGNSHSDYIAKGYDIYGNQNLTWSPIWGTTNSKGTAISTGGTATTGYTSKYTAGMTIGFDNITITDSLAFTSNQSCINITYDNPDHLVYISGDDQQQVVNNDLSQEIKVRVVNETGVPVGGVKINFTFINVPLGSTGYYFKESGLDNYQDISNETGIVNATIHIGTKIGNYIINVSGLGLSGVNGSIYIDTINATAKCDVLYHINLTPYYTIPPGRSITFGTTYSDYVAKGYDKYYNQILTWSPVWGSSNGLGIAMSTGGSAATGYTAKYTAGSVEGIDNITVDDTGWLASNRSAFSITKNPPALKYIQLTPKYFINSPRMIGASQTLVGYRAIGFDPNNIINLTWTPVWDVTNSLGIVINTGGNPISGYTAKFIAGIKLGFENITVSNASGSINNRSAIKVVSDNLSFIHLTPMFKYPGGCPVKAGEMIEGFIAWGFDRFGNKNLSWSPVWATSNNLGVVSPTGGNAQNGFTARFNANGVPGYDNLTVSDTITNVFNQTCIRIISGELSYISISPMNNYPLSSEVMAGHTLSSYLAFGFDYFGNLNTSWSPIWNTTHGLGSVVNREGNGVLGYSATYSAGTKVGYDNITVEDSATGLVANKSCIHIIPAFLNYISLIPRYNPPEFLNVRVSESTTSFIAKGYDRYGNLNTSWNAIWSTSDLLGNIGIVGGEPVAGYIAKYHANTKTGFDNITVKDSQSGLVTNKSSIKIIPAEPYQMNISPNHIKLTVNSTQIFELTVFDEYSNIIIPAGTIWSTNAGELIDITDTTVTLLTSKTPAKSVYVKAQLSKLEANAIVNIIPDILDIIVLNPAYVQVLADMEQEFNATGYDRYGNRVTLEQTSWITNAGILVSSNNTYTKLIAQRYPKNDRFVSVTASNVSGKAVVDILEHLYPPNIIGKIENVHLQEDDPPYTLNLTKYEYDFEDVGPELDWFITENDESLYRLTGQYSDNDQIVITPLPNIFGNDLVTLWVIDSDELTDFQKLWINITPVNDPPEIKTIPIIYIEPGAHQFDLSGYISDIDSATLFVSVDSDDSDLKVEINGMTLKLESNHELKTTITIEISDGELYTSTELEVVVQDNNKNEIGIWNLFIILLIAVVIIVSIFVYIKYQGFYKIEALYLIYHDGRLITYVEESKRGGEGDEEILSGMFTAIQDLIDETFTKDSGENQTRKKIEFGSKNILIEKGNNLYLTLIVEGRPGKNLQNQMAATVSDIEEEFTDFNDWNGKRHELKGLDSHFEKFIKSDEKNNK